MNFSAEVDRYILSFPRECQEKLEQVRSTIKHAAPEAEEVISYQMPAFKFHGMLVYYAGYKNHIGFYAIPSGHKQFEQELKGYKQGKGSVQFPLNQPMPLELIERIVRFRVQENLNKAAAKKS
jgi:uncharacterized protein YdhG (YjbR/CyaY superfamily)